jgi:porphobilinogen synthase
MSFPHRRLRRLRRTPALRALRRETRLSPAQLVLPLFLHAGVAAPRPIDSLPGQQQWPPASVVEPARRAWELGVRSVLLFGIPNAKDPLGESALDPEGPVPQAVRALKKELPELVVITDVCLCEYTDHGHCGVLRDERVDNDATLPRLGRMAVCHADAGADIVAPSDMMDGRVRHLRQALDERGHTDLPILSYAAKYASHFYGPFRDAAESPPAFGDRRDYQMDPANAREALLEVAQDVEEGADLVMVKPALPYLDILRAVRDRHDLPLVAYHVSGEYAMLKAAAARGWLDERACALEMLTGIARAGADLIITYYALEAAAWLSAGSGASPAPNEA